MKIYLVRQKVPRVKIKFEFIIFIQTDLKRIKVRDDAPKERFKLKLRRYSKT